MTKFAALIVEDTPEYQELYRRAVERQGGDAYIVSCLDDAIAAIKRRLYPVAIIDVRLSEDDETNIDGLKVLEFMREFGDRTNAILITGYGSFQIAREAFRQYEVFEGLEKGVALDVIEATIRRAYQSFAEPQQDVGASYSNTLKGREHALWEWENRALKVASSTGGMDGLYRFFDGLLRDFVPLIPNANEAGCLIYDQKKLACGRFWSRGCGAAVLISFGNRDEVRRLESEISPTFLTEGLHYESSVELGAVLKKFSSHGIYGLVRKLVDQDYSQYEP
jgi:ActR/RegA family two-component response regulator